MVAKGLVTRDVPPSMGKCHATKKVSRQVSVNGKKVRLSGTIRCRKEVGAHVHHPGIKHSGQFNHKLVEWKPSSEEMKQYRTMREQIREAAKK